MSFPTLAALDLPGHRAQRPADEPLEHFLDDGLRVLEERLSAECRELGRGLGTLGDVLARAVGTEGRGGGRWRPLLTLAAAEAYRGSRASALDVAVAVELTHTASLVLDDLPCMDDSPLRRGQPATHRLVGSAGAILLSVSLLARATELLGRQPRTGGALCTAWGRTVGLRGMAGGQALDVSAPRPLRGAARRLHREKSTALPALALASGARIAGADDAACAELEAFGRSLGWAYQLIDDVEDAGEDGPRGAGSEAHRLLLLSRRILRRAQQRLRAVPAPSPEGLEILIALADRVAAPRPPAPRVVAAGALERSH